tara:strand:- start:1975 stop:2715 length:741 start_codon:yes stop_codon:yes gene_type:complete
MTYGIGMKTDNGLLFMSDTRTNAGVDNISIFKKMFTWATDGQSVTTILAAGNLATTQSLISILDGYGNKTEDSATNLLNQTSMFELARVIGKKLKEVIQSNSDSGQSAGSSFHATLIMGGQIKGDEPRIFMIYPEGNFIEVSTDNPFFQIGETKYGKPILIRAFDPRMTFSDGLKLMLLSFDSTIEANLSVAPPLDFQIYEKDSFKLGANGRIEADDPYYRKISKGWSLALKSAFQSMPNLIIKNK